jgi:hypothetical protein
MYINNVQHHFVPTCFYSIFSLPLKLLMLGKK